MKTIEDASKLATGVRKGLRELADEVTHVCDHLDECVNRLDELEYVVGGICDSTAEDEAEEENAECKREFVTAFSVKMNGLGQYEFPACEKPESMSVTEYLARLSIVLSAFVGELVADQFETEQDSLRVMKRLTSVSREAIHEAFAEEDED